MQQHEVSQFLSIIIKQIMGGLDCEEQKNPLDVLDDLDREDGIKRIPDYNPHLKDKVFSDLNHLFWNGKASRNNMDILIEAFHRMNLTDNQVNFITAVMAEGIAAKEPELVQMSYSAVPDICDAEDEPSDDTSYDSQSPDIEISEKLVKPHQIYDFLSQDVYGQEEAKEAASMMLWEHLQGITSNLLFVGPTGSGKTEIFRQLSKVYDGIYIADAASITQAGWKGDTKISTIIGAAAQTANGNNPIIVLDEADKMFEARPAGGEGMSYAIQNELLKVLEGGYIQCGKMIIDTSHISFCFLGAFEKMLSVKKSSSGGIGFGEKVGEDRVTYADAFTDDDLVRYGGVRREIAGRIGKIVQLSAMTADDFYQILCTPDMSPIDKLEKQFGKRLVVSDDLKRELSKEAADSRLGVRQMTSQLKRMLEKHIFAEPESPEYEM